MNTFHGFTQLTSLDLSNNFITQLDLLLSDCTSLIHLDLSSNSIQRFNEGFISQLKALSNSTEFKISLKGNQFSCSCQSIPFVAWLVGSIRPTILDRDSIHCLYLNETDYLVKEIRLGQLRDSCLEKVRFIENYLKTILTPILTILVMCGFGAMLCYHLRWYIWWEWHVVHKRKKQLDAVSFTNEVFIACEDSHRTTCFVRRIHEDTQTHVPSSKDIDLNMGDLDQDGTMMEESRKIMFFIDIDLINNLRKWAFLIPDVITSRPLDDISVLLDVNILDSSLRGYYPLWKLSKSRRCFLGYYNGNDTNSDVWSRVIQFVKSSEIDNGLQGQNILNMELDIMNDSDRLVDFNPM